MNYLTLCLLFGSTIAANQEKCRALALRGGGTKGNYEVGVLKSFLANLPAEEIAYDVVVGVSIGAVNAGTIGIFEKGNETAAFAQLVDYWSILKTDEIFLQWPHWGPLAGFWKNSFFDMTPSHVKVNQRLTNPMKRKVSFQAVNINDGTVHSFDENLDPKLQGESVAASASIPIAFQPTTTIDNMQLVDGGTFSDLNLQDAIHKCREVVDNDEDIIVDVIMCLDAPVKMNNFVDWQYLNPWHIYKRQAEFKEYYKEMNDVLVVANSNPKVNYRYVVSATETLPGGRVPIFVKPGDLKKTYDIGFSDGIKAINNDTAYAKFKDYVADYEYFTLRSGEGFD